jgi:hypothetical protein
MLLLPCCSVDVAAVQVKAGAKSGGTGFSLGGLLNKE